jgi:hypothetical protein
MPSPRRAPAAKVTRAFGAGGADDHAHREHHQEEHTDDREHPGVGLRRAPTPARSTTESRSPRPAAPSTSAASRRCAATWRARRARCGTLRRPHARRHRTAGSFNVWTFAPQARACVARSRARSAPVAARGPGFAVARATVAGPVAERCPPWRPARSCSRRVHRPRRARPPPPWPAWCRRRERSEVGAGGWARVGGADVASGALSAAAASVTIGFNAVSASSHGCAGARSSA